MKIIKKGAISEEKVYRIECNHCKCVFEIMEKEGSIIFDQRDGNYLQYDCPTCSRSCMAALNVR